MGNDLSSDGIVEKGYPVTKICDECQKPFETRDGIVTCKGPSPSRIHCRECSKAIFLRFFPPVEGDEN